MGSPEEMGAPPSGSELPWFSLECSLEICLQTRHKKDPLETQQTSAVTRQSWEIEFHSSTATPEVTRRCTSSLRESSSKSSDTSTLTSSSRGRTTTLVQAGSRWHN